MKILIVTLAGLLALFMGGLNWQGDEDISEAESMPITGQAHSMDQISGAWHGFPSGLLLQINQDGSAIFGQDGDGQLIGYRAEMMISNQQLQVRFSDYSGSEASCANAVGSYTVKVHESGGLLFDPIQDDCHFRLQLLSGPSEPGILYHRFD